MLRRNGACAETLEGRICLAGGTAVLAGWAESMRQDAAPALGAAGNAFTSDTAIAPPQSDVGRADVLGQWGGSIDAVVVSGTTVYLGQGQSLVILDVADPAHPREVGRLALSGDTVRGISIAGNTAYVAEGYTGIEVIGLSDPARPVLLGSYYTTSYAHAVKAVGTTVYVANGDGGLRVVDFGNPASPAILSTHATGTWARDVSVVGDTAYVVDDTGGLRVIDVSDPGSPVLLGSYQTTAWVQALRVVDGIAYVADYGLTVIDVRDPANPVRLGGCATVGNSYGLSVVGDTVYIASHGGGLEVIDVSDPANPTSREVFRGAGDALAIAAAGSTAYVADYQWGLRIFDVSNPVVPMQAGVYQSSLQAQRVSVIGDTAYVADGDGGLHVLDVGDPARPVRLGGYDTSGSAYGVSVVGSTAYVADDGSGLQVIDVSDPAHPARLGGYATGGHARDVSVVGSIAYVVADWQGLNVIEVSNPANPVLLGMCDAVRNGYGVAVVGNLAYVADYYNGLQVVDVSNPASPVWLGGYGTGGFNYDVRVVGSIAYVAAGDAGLQVIDVSDPAHPVGIGECETSAWALGVDVVGNWAYVAENNSGLMVLDISDPAHPVRLAEKELAGEACGVRVVGDIAYVADETNGLVVLGFGHGPTDITLAGTTVAENQGTGTVVGAFSATGPDGVFTYALVPGLGSEDNALFTTSGKVLKTIGTFDFESRSSYSIRVQATNSSGLSYQKTFTIQVADLPEFGLQRGRTWRITIPDSDGDVVTLALGGGGSGIVQPDHRVALTGTTMKSVLTITVKKGGGGDGHYALAGIAADGLLKSIAGAKVFVNGDITLNTGGMASAGAVAISLAGVTDGSIDTHGIPISSLKLLEWQGTDEEVDQVVAPWIGAITVSGRKEDPRTAASEWLAGDWEADVVTSSNNRGVAIGVMKVAGSISGAQLWASGTIKSISAKGRLAGSRVGAADGIGAITVMELRDSDVLVGVSQGFAGRFATAGAFVNPAAKLGKLTVTGLKLPKVVVPLEYVVNSQISAALYGTVALVDVPESTPLSPMLHVGSDTGVLKVKQLMSGMVVGGTWKGGVEVKPGQTPRPGLVEVVGG